MRGKALIATFLILGISFNLAPAQILPSPDTAKDFLSGRRDGERDAREKMIWALGGCIYAPLSLLTRYSKTPRFFVERLIGRSSDYVSGYMETFPERKGLLDAGWAWAGFSLITICASILKYIDISIFGLEEILKDPLAP